MKNRETEGKGKERSRKRQIQGEKKEIGEKVRYIIQFNQIQRNQKISRKKFNCQMFLKNTKKNSL